MAARQAVPSFADDSGALTAGSDGIELGATRDLDATYPMNPATGKRPGIIDQGRRILCGSPGRIAEKPFVFPIELYFFLRKALWEFWATNCEKHICHPSQGRFILRSYNVAVSPFKPEQKRFLKSWEVFHDDG